MNRFQKQFLTGTFWLVRFSALAGLPMPGRRFSFSP
jgi:hypothetical protein